MRDLLFSAERHPEAACLLGTFSADYHAGLAARPVFLNVDRAALRAVMEAPLPATGVPLVKLFDDHAQVLVPNSTHTAHPRFLPYVQPPPNSLSPYADQIAAILK